MIKQRTLGRTGLKLSELALGTLNFGWQIDEPTAFALLDAYHAAGGNFIHATGHHRQLLLPSASASPSEEMVGRWWRSRNIPRGDLVLATRIIARQPAGGSGALAELVRQLCRESLQRLKTTYLDFVVFEWSDDLLPIGETFDAFDYVVRCGLARYIVAANFPVWRVADSLGRAYLRNHSRPEALQTDYSLMIRARFEPEAMALCQEHRLGFLARSPLAGGFLTRLKPGSDLAGSLRWDRFIDRFGAEYAGTALAAVGDVAARHEASSGQVALAWVLDNPVVTSAIVGVRSVPQLNELLAAGRLSLTARDLRQLSDATAAEEIRVLAGSASQPRQAGELVLN